MVEWKSAKARKRRKGGDDCNSNLIFSVDDRSFDVRIKYILPVSSEVLEFYGSTAMMIERPQFDVEIFLSVDP